MASAVDQRRVGGDVSQRAVALLGDQFASVHGRTDRLFACLMILQWVAGIGIALGLSSLRGSGGDTETHPHVWIAVVLGGIVTSLPVFLAVTRPGASSTRHVIAVAQMVWSALLIDWTGGRIETHFHVFGSMALLACYRDWRVLVTATAVVAADHLVRGMVWPQSIYGVLTAEPYRAIEHVGWLLLEDAFLLISIRQSVREMADLATQQSRLEETNRLLKVQFEDRTREFQSHATTLESQAVSLQEARDDAEAANRAKTQFLATMSHEIRTPLTAILGFSDILLTHGTSSESVKAATIIKRNGEFLLDIVNEVLDLSKIEAGKLTVEHLRCSPRLMVSEVALLMRMRAEAKGLPLVIEHIGEIPETILSDPTRIRQILVNLVSNAIKFSQRGEIRIQTQLVRSLAQEPVLRYDVIDQGIGLDRSQRDNLFRPYMQADISTARIYGGTGLGLTISKRLAEMLGGTIGVESTPGVGSRFSVTIATGPLESVPSFRGSREHAAEEPPVDSPPCATVALNCRVLLADDSPDNQELVSFVLQKSGAQVSVADNGARAVELAQAAQAGRQPFDVILMDMEMPVLDGFAATRHLRAQGYTGPIIALTAHSMHEDLEKCLEAGCDAYATKPIDGHLLELVARYSLRRGEPAEPSVLSQ